MGMVPLVCKLCNITKRSHEKATRTKKLTGGFGFGISGRGIFAQGGTVAGRFGHRILLNSYLYPLREN